MQPQLLWAHLPQKVVEIEGDIVLGCGKRTNGWCLPSVASFVVFFLSSPHNFTLDTGVITQVYGDGRLIGNGGKVSMPSSGLGGQSIQYMIDQMYNGGNSAGENC